MRANQSFTASGTESSNGTHTLEFNLAGVARFGLEAAQPSPNDFVPGPAVGIAYGDGLLHDARNLIGAMRLYCDLLDEPGVLAPEHRACAEELRSLTFRTSDLMEQWMRHREPAAMPARADRPACPPRSFGSILQRSSGMLNRVAGLPIVWTIDPGVTRVAAASPEALERVLLNLVHNAADALLASGSNKPLRISAERRRAAPGWHSHPVLVLTVEDEGCGMNFEQVRSLLNPVPVRNSSGHGMGFQVVRELVREAGGELELASTAGVGTRIRISWPLASSRTTETPLFRKHVSKREPAAMARRAPDPAMLPLACDGSARFDAGCRVC